MGLFENFRKKERAEPESTGVLDETNVEEPLLSAWLLDEKPTRYKAIEIPSITGCVNKIARTVADIPIKLYKKENGKIVEVQDDRRVFLLNKETGDTLDAFQMKQAMIRDYYLGRGGYCYVKRNGLKVESLHYVFSDHIAVAANADVIFKEYVILVQGKSYYPHEFIRLLRNTTDGIHGHSIVEENEKILSIAYNSLAFEENLVKTGGNKKGFVKSAKRLTKEAMDVLKEAWRKLYRNNSENVVILNDGLEFQESSNTSVEMQLNENKKTNSDEICKIFGIPPSVLNGGGSEQDEKALIKYCVNSILGEFMTALDRALLLESEKDSYFFAPDTYELTKGDVDKRYSAYKTAAETGWLQIDEIREKENMEPLGMRMVKLGLQDVLYDPVENSVYILNTNKKIKLGKGESEEWQESNSEVKMDGNLSGLTDM